MQNYIPQGQIPNMQQFPQVQSQPVANTQPGYPMAPQAQPQPNYAGVNIQIFNPMVGTPTGSIYPQQTTSAYNSGTQGGCYPVGYYTGQYPQGSFIPQNPYGQSQTNGIPQGGPNINSGYYDANGVYYPQNPNNHPLPGTPVTSEVQDIPKPEQAGEITEVPNKKDIPLQTDKPTDEEIKQISEDKQPEDADIKDSAQPTEEKTLDENSEKTNKNPSADEASKKNGTKTEKRKIVELSDDYIKTLENYLNSQDSEVRLMGAKEVVNRAMEDDSRKDDPALTALVNKMLQDPSEAIRAIALSLIDSRTILGDDFTVDVLKKMQTSQSGFGQDSVQATSALLKMAGKTVEKEFEVKETSKADKR